MTIIKLIICTFLISLSQLAQALGPCTPESQICEGLSPIETTPQFCKNQYGNTTAAYYCGEWINAELVKESDISACHSQSVATDRNRTTFSFGFPCVRIIAETNSRYNIGSSDYSLSIILNSCRVSAQGENRWTVDGTGRSYLRCIEKTILDLTDNTPSVSRDQFGRVAL